MTYTDLSPLANHLWQSTVFAAAVWALTLALRQNRAAVRYWLWLAASVKFLLPFSLLVSIGSQIGWRTAPAVESPQWSFVVEQISHPFTGSAAAPQVVAPAASNPIPAVLLGVWFCGAVGSIAFWLRCWRQMRAVRRAATPVDLDLPIPAMSSAARLEPGVFGISEPVLLLPEGITDRLTPAQLEAILAHEMCHVRRRDNLTAAIHMVVETLFWFHPLVWWI
jgi:bla regulator protein BlaR1